MSKDKPRDIGVDVEAPANPWDGDPDDPFFGTLPVRGQVLRGIVVKSKAQKTVVVQINKMKYDSKYERYARSSSKISAHSHCLFSFNNISGACGFGYIKTPILR